MQRKLLNAWTVLIMFHQSKARIEKIKDLLAELNTQKLDLEKEMSDLVEAVDYKSSV